MHREISSRFHGGKVRRRREEDTFELVAASAEHCWALGYTFTVVEATNQWTEAVCVALGGMRVHFASLLARPTVRESADPLEGSVTSSSGLLADKNSGCMFYVIRFA